MYCSYNGKIKTYQVKSHTKWVNLRTILTGKQIVLWNVWRMILQSLKIEIEMKSCPCHTAPPQQKILWANGPRLSFKKQEFKYWSHVVFVKQQLQLWSKMEWLWKKSQRNQDGQMHQNLKRSISSDNLRAISYLNTWPVSNDNCPRGLTLT